MPVSLIHDPVWEILETLEVLYPDLDALIWFYDKPMTKFGVGLAWEDPLGRPVILLNKRCPYEIIPETIAHEAAHLLTNGQEIDAHGEKWQTCFSKIWTEHLSRQTERYETVQEGLCRGTEKQLRENLETGSEGDREQTGRLNLTPRTLRRFHRHIFESFYRGDCPTYLRMRMRVSPFTDEELGIEPIKEQAQKP